MKRLYVLLTCVLFGCAGGLSDSDTPLAPPGDPAIDYDIVYVRYSRAGDLQQVGMPAGEKPYHISGGADLMLLHPDGSDEILVDCDETQTVLDPTISFDGQWVYYVKLSGLVPTEPTHKQQGAGFIYKMRLDGSVQEIQLTDGSSGFETGKLAGNGAADEAALTARFGFRDLAPAPLPGGRILLLSNREAIVTKDQTLGGSVGSPHETASQLYVMDDHDGSHPNLNLRLIGHSGVHNAQHPIVLRDGRIMYTTWDDAGVQASYGSATLFVCDPDGGNVKQFLEPHNTHKRVDHWVSQLSSGQIVCPSYYPGAATFGFGALYRYPLHGQGANGQPYTFEINPAEDDYRLFSRIGLKNITPHTSGAHQRAPNDSGRYSSPSGAPGDALLVSYSSGPVVFKPPSGSDDTPFVDSGIYFFPDAGQGEITDPADVGQLVLLKNDPAYNEMQPRAVVPYSRIYGVAEPGVPSGDNPYAPTQRQRSEPGQPVGFTGTSSMLNRESTPVSDWTNHNHHKLGHTGLTVQGTDAGVIDDDDVHGVRIIVAVPDRYHDPYPISTLEKEVGLVQDTRAREHVAGYYSVTHEKWKIAGEFPIRGVEALRGSPVSQTDPGGAPDTSFLAQIPADTPMFIQAIDQNGLMLYTEQTWRHARVGQTVADCGGCHAHSIDTAPIAFQGKRADHADYQPWELTKNTPLIENGVVQTNAAGLVGYEFRRDVYPVMERECASCHTAASGLAPPLVSGQEPHLALFEQGLTGYEAEVRAYRALVKDDDGVYSFGTTPPANRSNYEFPQLTRYLRAIQARQSLLAWKIYGARLDGRTNATFPVDAAGRDEDFDFELGICEAPGRLTASEKGAITRWIDLGCPIDLDRPKERYTDDTLVPSVSLEVFAQGGTVVVRVGALDLGSGLDPSRFQLTVEHGASTTFYSYGDLGFNPNGVGEVTSLVNAIEVTEIAPLTVRLSVGDQAGNTQTAAETLHAVE